MNTSIPAHLYLKQGGSFDGLLLAPSSEDIFGEVVFTTGMTGYVESITDPSFVQQILVFTYPLIGNYGVPSLDKWESVVPQVAAVVVAEAASFGQHHQMECSLADWLRHHNVPLLHGVDTRALTLAVREHGAAAGAISTKTKRPTKFIDINRRHLVKEVSITAPEIYGAGKKTIIAYDCGMKANILRELTALGIRVKRVPFDYDLAREKEPFHGVFVSNGPGDPARAVETIQQIRFALSKNISFFGICLGAQLLALAIGAKTYKLPFGHRGLNQPCLEVGTHQAFLTSQNHGYAIVEKSIPKGWDVTFRHLNDGTVSGIAHRKKPFFAVQFHPEAAPGPHDTKSLFRQFIESL